MDWNKIRQEYESTDITLKDLAVKYGVSEGTMRSRKNREKWQRNATKNATQRKKQRATKKKNVATEKKPSKEPKIRIVVNNKEIEIDESPELTEKQRLFCIYFIKNHNATMSAIKAGYAKDSAHVEGSRLLRNAKVSTEIRRLKGRALQELFVDAMDILEVYTKIAFADIGDYVTFGQRQEQVIGMYGPVFQENEETGKKDKPVMQTVNYIDLKEGKQVDTTIISEVKQGRDGVSIKLLDKMKALEKLEKYLDILPDHHKRKMEEEKLKIDQAKLELEKAKAGDPEDDKTEDGFIDALEGKTEGVWSDEK